MGADVPLSRVDDDRQAPQDSATVSSDTPDCYRCSLQARVDIKRSTASGTVRTGVIRRTRTFRANWSYYSSGLMTRNS